MTIARISEDKDAKNTGVFIVLLLLLVIGICIAGMGQKSGQDSGLVKQSVTDSPVGYP
jgi:hypothetical protein